MERDHKVKNDLKKPRIIIINHIAQEQPSSMDQKPLPPSSSSSAITRIAQDHLFSILILLPVQSILSFSMTCKKFQSLTCSDPFWEAICRRDWGHSSVDSLKLSHHQKQDLTWKKLYQKVYQMDSVSCHRILSDSHGDELPSPRASHSLNYLSGCLVLFGGGCEGGRHLDDTWVAHIGDDTRKIIKWQKIKSGIPSGRFGHSCVVLGDSLVLFGGINDNGIRQNDTWVGQIVLHEQLGITLSWKLLETVSIAPPPRGAHAACCLDDKRMLIHGGIGLGALRLDDTWILNFDLSENISFGSWREVVTNPSPSSRSGHTLTHITEHQTILFGGRGLGYEVLDDVWLFDASEGHWKWIQLYFELENITHGLSLPRVGHSATLILGDRLLIHGGEDSHRIRKDDFWLLDIKSLPLTPVQPITPKEKELFTKMWRRIKTKGDKPNSRSFHRACVDHSKRYMYLFGGMVDGLLQPAASSGLRFDGGLFLVELVPQS